MPEYRPVRPPRRGRLVPPSTIEDGGGWYTYEFETRLSCAVPGCRLDHPLYIGKTNRPWEREDEHAEDKPWYPYRCGYRIHETTYDTERDALAAELEMIHDRLPLANKAGNGRNEHRLDFDALGSTARAYRAPTRREPPVARRPEPRAEWRPTVPRPRVRLTRRQQRSLAWTGAWLVTAGGLWWAQANWSVPWAGWWRVGVAGAAPLIVAWWWEGMSRRKRRRLVFGVAAALAVVAAAVLARTWPELRSLIAGLR